MLVPMCPVPSRREFRDDSSRSASTYHSALVPILSSSLPRSTLSFGISLYFSAASYATVGVVLPQTWRTLGPVEIGVLMCGLSASVLFAIVTRLVERETRVSDTPITDTRHASPGTRIRQSVSLCRARTFEIRREGLSAKQRGSDSRLPLPHTKAAGPPARQDTLSRYSLGQNSHQGKERHPFQILGTLLPKSCGLWRNPA